MKQIGSRDDADDLAFRNDRNALDAVAFHYTHDVLQGGIDIHRTYVPCHHVADASTAGTTVFIGQPARPDEKLDPSRPPTLRADLGSAQKVALGDDADNIPRVVDNGQAADPVLQH